MRPERYSREGSITLPSLSTGLEILKVAKMVAAVSQRVENAIWFPGHNLCVYFFKNQFLRLSKISDLRPNPKAIVAGSRMVGSSCPSLINLSGLKADGSGYSFSLWSIALYKSGHHSSMETFLYKCGEFIPEIADNNRPIRNMISLVNVIFGGTVRNTWSNRITWPSTSHHCSANLPYGVAGSHLNERIENLISAF